MVKTKIGGLLGGYYDKIYKNFFCNTDANRHADAYVGKHEKWYAEPEFAGKYMDICTAYYETKNDKAALSKARRVMRSVIKNQRADGYLDLYKEEEAPGVFYIWNQTFTLLGLIGIYEVCGDKKALLSAVKCADWVIRHFNGGADITDSINDGAEHISVLIAISRLYRITGKKDYCDFIYSVLEKLENGKLNLLSFKNLFDLRSQKGIEMLVVWLGLADFYTQVKDERILSAAKRYWTQVRDTQIRNTGNGTIDEVWTENALNEIMIPLSVRPNENCVAVGFIEFSLALFYIERDMKYLDAVEKSLFNHLTGSLSADGTDFAYYQATFGQKIYQTADYAYKCCRYRGVSMFAYLPKCLFYSSSDEIIPMIYTDCEYEDEFISVKEITDYPFNGRIVFELNLKKDNVFKLRIPDWCKSFSVVSDGADTDLTLLDLTKGKHEIILSLEFGVTAIVSEKEEKRVSFNYGPLLLAADKLKSGFDLENFTAARGALPEKQGDVFLLCGNINGNAAEAVLTDYSSAGRENPEENGFLIWIKSE